MVQLILGKRGYSPPRKMLICSSSILNLINSLHAEKLMLSAKKTCFDAVSTYTKENKITVVFECPFVWFVFLYKAVPFVPCFRARFLC